MEISKSGNVDHEPQLLLLTRNCVFGYEMNSNLTVNDMFKSYETMLKI